MNRNRKFFFELWKIIFTKLNIDFLYSIFYHFQTNDSSERINQIVEIALRFYINNLKKSTLWFKALLQFQIVMNNFRSFSISKTSNEIFYEFTFNKSLNLVQQDNIIIKKEFSQERTKAKDAIFWININYKIHYDRKHTSMFLKVENWVLIKLHHDYNISINLNITKKLA